MQINDMNMEEVTARLAEISSELETRSGEELEALASEVAELNERKAELEAYEQRKAAAEALNSGEIAGTVIERKEVIEMTEVRTYGIDSPEYRDAFYALIAGTATAEQRAIVVDNTAPGNGDAIAIPKALDDMIWDNIHTAHPILADITTVRSGIAMEVTKHTAITNRVAKKLDKDANAGEEENTFVKVVLYGYDYEKFVELTYAEAKMSQGALEQYLADEIAAELGESLAKDVFTQIETDATVSQKVTATADMFADVKGALALATLAGAPVIYAPATAYYEIVGAVKSGSPFNIGATLGCAVKLDNAATHVVVVDPKAFVLNEVQSITIESDRDVKNHKVIVSGYLRAQGTLRKNKAAAYIA